MPEEKDSKSSVGYMLKPATQYCCSDCVMFLDEKHRCMILGDENVLVTSGCNNFVPGTPASFGENPLYVLNGLEVGLTHTDYGFSCKRCIHFNEENWDCEEVDKNSEGDTLGMIHPDACCNEWEPDPVRGGLPTEAVRQLVGRPDALRI